MKPGRPPIKEKPMKKQFHFRLSDALHKHLTENYSNPAAFVRKTVEEKTGVK